MAYRIGNEIDNIVDLIMQDYALDRDVDEMDIYNMPDRDAVVDIVNKMLRIVYPGYYREHSYRSYSPKRQLTVLIEDVMTSGKALRESLPKLKSAADVDVTGMVITVDRMEKSLTSDNSAVQDAYKEFGIRVYSIVTINDIIKAIEDGVVEGREYLPAMRQYRADYGVEY